MHPWVAACVYGPTASVRSSVSATCRASSWFRACERAFLRSRFVFCVCVRLVILQGKFVFCVARHLAGQVHGLRRTCVSCPRQGGFRHLPYSQVQQSSSRLSTMRRRTCVSLSRRASLRFALYVRSCPRQGGFRHLPICQVQQSSSRLSTLLRQLSVYSGKGVYSATAAGGI